MKTIDLSTLGQGAEPTETGAWENLGLTEAWLRVVHTLAPGSVPTDVQARALQEGRLMTSRRNLLISAPTNSGKSLLAYLALLRGIQQGGRVLLLVPLRAIAQEKYDELRTLCRELADVIGREIQVTITTGDYRLHEESMQTPPPESGELVIATPERLEAIFRNPDFDSWIASFQVVCVDEAHLIADEHRGASLEYVIASFRSIAAPPRVVLLSATLGDTDPLVKWLDPCDPVVSTVRRPPLNRRLHCLEKGDDLKRAVSDLAQELLLDPQASVLIFVYQTSWAGALARELQQELGELCGTAGAAAYHSRLSAETRARVRDQFLRGTTRCVVTTAALAMGVNLPATHVIVRDLNYGPEQPLSIGALTQMMGRAGRGNRPGQAFLMVREGVGLSPQELLAALQNPELPALQSVLMRSGSENRSGEPALAETVLSLLARRAEDGFTQEGIEQFMAHTLCGIEAVPGCLPALKWLSKSSSVLAYEKDGIWKPTRLGQAAIRGSLPLRVAVGVAQLIRDLLSVDPEDSALSHWSTLDLLLLVELVTNRPLLRKSFSENLAQQVDDWASRDETKSVLFQHWIRGASGFSKAQQLLGSLGLENNGTSDGKGRKQNTSKTARERAYLAMFRAIILWQRSQGAMAADLERRWQIRELDEIQEQWRDDRLFLLGALRGIWDIRCYFFHLKEDCAANDERILRVKRAFQRVNILSLQLLNMLKWCSPLGAVFSRLRANRSSGQKGSPAQGTMRRLEDAGIVTVAQLREQTLDELISLGVRSDMAAQIQAFLRRR